MFIMQHYASGVMQQNLKVFQRYLTSETCGRDICLWEGTKVLIIVFGIVELVWCTYSLFIIPWISYNNPFEF